MKKLLAAVTMTAMIGTAVYADFTRVEVGAGAWMSEPSGALTYSVPPLSNHVDLEKDMGYDKESFPYFWINVKHPVPILPNVRVEYVDVEFEGDSQTTFDWEGINYGTDTYSKLQMTQTDIILYYNILDNTAWLTLDLGLDVKIMDFNFDIREEATGESYSESETLPLPTLYLRGRVEVPATDIGLEADIKYLGVSDSKFYDARIKADYTLDIFPVVQPAIEVGYRVMKLEVDEDDVDVKTNIDFSGLYFGVMLRF